MDRSTSRRPRAGASIVTVAVSVLLVACAAPAPSASTPATPTPAPTVPVVASGSPGDSPATSPSATDPCGAGDALSVAVARSISADRLLRIRASMIVDTTVVQPLIFLCDAMTKSLPPQCAGETVRVAGISPEQLAGRAVFQRRGRIAWSGSIELVGKLFGDIFQVMEEPSQP